MNAKDYYQILGVSRNASPDEIKRAFRVLARRYHPDRSKEANAEARFKEIAQAYEVLRDPRTRNDYDRMGGRWRAGQDFNPPPGWDKGDDGDEATHQAPGRKGFGEFLNGLFSRRQRDAKGVAEADGPRAGRSDNSAQARRQRQDDGTARDARQHGADTHTRISVNLEDAYQGVMQTVHLKHTVLGADNRPYQTDRTIEVNIPKGVRPGQQIRVAGQGGAAIGKGTPGDLYLEVEIKPHRLYKVDGRDVSLDLPVTPAELALGATVTAPTPTGSVELTIPPNSRPGRRLRIRERGIPGHTPGSFFVILQVALPPANTEAAREAYRRFDDALPFNPRADLT